MRSEDAAVDHSARDKRPSRLGGGDGLRPLWGSRPGTGYQSDSWRGEVERPVWSTDSFQGPVDSCYESGDRRGNDGRVADSKSFIMSDL